MQSAHTPTSKNRLTATLIAALTGTLITTLGASTSAVANPVAHATPRHAVAKAPSSRNDATQWPAVAAHRLNALLDEDLAEGYRRWPLAATLEGVPGYNARLPDFSAAELQRHKAYERDVLARLRAIDPARLQGQDRVSYALMLDKFSHAVERQAFPRAQALVLSTLGGVQSFMPFAAQMMSFRSEADYRDYLRRIQGMPRWVDQTIARLNEGRRSGWMHSQAVVDRIIASIDAQRVNKTDDSIVFSPFTKVASTVPAIPETTRGVLAESARRAIERDYLPALQSLKTFLKTQYRPHAPVEGGLAALPGGAAYYNFLIRSGIDPRRDAAHIHALGEQEVQRLHERVGEVAKQTGFTGSVAQFMTHVRTDRSFFFTSEDAVLAAYRAMPARVDPQLPKLFHAVPRMPYAIRGMTASESASSTAANYTLGSLKLGTSGYFTVNARGYATETTWQVETLFSHETVPGHHMQGARAAEIEGLHAWRRRGLWNVPYGEGWALYAERLGYEIGLYADPMQHYGQLQAELFRAARLVVDTGLHADRWPRQKAIDYMVREAGLDELNAASEVDRYVSNPTQALGYLIGQRKFLELRARAERALGDRFDIRDFHAVAIDSGTLTLAVLEQQVDAWIARSTGKGATGKGASGDAGR